MRLKNDREFHCWNVFFTLRIAESCRNCQAREPRIYSSGFDEQREKSNEGKNGQRASKCGLYRSNRSQTASVRTFKNDLMWPGLACTGATEERVRGKLPRKATCCTSVTHDALVRSSNPEHHPLSLPLPVFILPNPFSVTFRVTICHGIASCRFSRYMYTVEMNTRYHWTSDKIHEGGSVSRKNWQRMD